MSAKDYANITLNTLSDSELYDFLTIFADDNTLALAESELLGENPQLGKSYHNFKELLAEIKEEMKNE